MVWGDSEMDGRSSVGLESRMLELAGEQSSTGEEIRPKSRRIGLPGLDWASGSVGARLLPVVCAGLGAGIASSNYEHGGQVPQIGWR